MRNRHRGFTLLEVLTVTGMVAVVSAVALPAYFRAVERSRQTEGAFVLSLIRASELRYEAENRTFTARWIDLDIQNPNLLPPERRYFRYELVNADEADFEAFARRRGRITLNPLYRYQLTIHRAGAIVEEPVMEPDNG